ncbi:type 1 glutamine amidotransferase domain-containing protein [Caenibacillus caldisaponilyticus]|uniref:type 1 glutamine amidotransferase domain-containing protein n=1 Tax=Caenibacillus caldisaponilyticus TaxID=1674942 RepID=UPI000988491E|nr:type 1 glutamine amidotransferase domain-containing protein [Caenibacillus caldisaponilyticus]
MSAKKILMVVTNHAVIDEEHRTGIWLEEFAVPYQVFKENGFEVTVASPKGGAAPVDPRSLNDEWKDEKALLDDTVKLADIQTDAYDALFFPGGHGTMFDFPNDRSVQDAIRRFDDQQKVIAAVCHGPAALVGATRSDGTPLVAGKTVTSFTDEEERASKLDAYMPFLLESKLRELGAKFVAKEKWSDHVEVDGHLVTGQNPQSSRSIALKVVELLKAE